MNVPLMPIPLPQQCLVTPATAGKVTIGVALLSQEQ